MIDRFSQTWLSLRKELTEEIDKAQHAIERRGLSIEETEYWRGRIAVCRELLALPTNTTDSE